MKPIQVQPVQVLLVDPESGLPENTSAYLASRGFAVQSSGGYDAAIDAAKASAFDAVIMPAPTGRDAPAALPFQNLLHAINACGAAGVVLAEDVTAWEDEVGKAVDFAPPHVSKEEIQGRLSAMMRYHRVVRAMERDLGNMQRLFKQMSGRFTEVDQEMRLAGRLQNAFLPQGLDRVGPAEFATLYRPATFVSGDIYDIYRVDERHVAFYVADAVGHGMAASLLTMFIKNAVVSKRIHDDFYEVLDPGQSLSLLNTRLCEQQLPNSQFVTAAFGLLNIETLQLQIARAGHPYPIHRSKNGTLVELKPPGGLLGLFDAEEFPAQTVQLARGDKLILYSDGLEVAFAESQTRPSAQHYYHEVLTNLSHLPGEELIAEFARQLDEEAGSLNPQDDVTLVIIDITD